MHVIGYSASIISNHCVLMQTSLTLMSHVHALKQPLFVTVEVHSHLAAGRTSSSSVWQEKASGRCEIQRKEEAQRLTQAHRARWRRRRWTFCFYNPHSRFVLMPDWGEGKCQQDTIKADIVVFHPVSPCSYCFHLLRCFTLIDFVVSSVVVSSISLVLLFIITSSQFLMENHLLFNLFIYLSASYLLVSPL